MSNDLMTLATAVGVHDEDDDWRGRAACAETPSEVFFPEAPTTGTTQAAKAVCSGCPVERQCLVFALLQNERNGVWGRTTGRERRGLRAAIRRAAEDRWSITAAGVHEFLDAQVADARELVAATA